MRTNKYTLLILALLFASLSVRAQYNPYWQWAKADTVNKLTVSNGGSVLAVKNGKAFWARMKNIARLSNYEGQGSWFISEHDSTGKQLNVTAIAGKVQLMDAQADAAGNWYVLGRFYDSLILASGGTLTRPFPATNIDGDHFIVRFNAGTLAVGWIKIVGPFANVSARSFTLDNTKIYVAADTAGGTSIRTMSLATGDILSSFLQTGSSTTSSIQVDGLGNVYLAGSCAVNGMNFNGATEPAGMDQYSYIVKYRPNGTHIWHYWMPDQFCFPRKLTLYKDNFLYFSGDLKDSFSIGGKPVHTPSNNAFDYVAARLDSSGKVYWTKQSDTAGGGHATMNAAYHAVVTPDTALVLFAQGSGYMYWSDTIVTDLQGVADATLVSIGADKVVRWERAVYTNYTSNQHVATEGTAIWVCGNAFSQTATVKMDTLLLKVPARFFVPFLAKTRLIRPIPVNPPQGVNGTWSDNVTLSPIPAHNALKIDGLDGECILTLTDITGREISRIHVIQGTRQAIFNVCDLPRGLYLIEMNSAGSRAARKILLQ